jgi:hypothetical protein
MTTVRINATLACVGGDVISVSLPIEAPSDAIYQEIYDMLTAPRHPLHFGSAKNAALYWLRGVFSQKHKPHSHGDAMLTAAFVMREFFISKRQIAACPDK